MKVLVEVSCAKCGDVLYFSYVESNDGIPASVPPYCPGCEKDEK